LDIFGLDKADWVLRALGVTIRCATTAYYDRDGKWGNCVCVKCFKIIEEEKEYFEASSNDQANLATVNNEYEQGFEYLVKNYY
jgi:hypothetical protein